MVLLTPGRGAHIFPRPFGACSHNNRGAYVPSVLQEETGATGAAGATGATGPGNAWQLTLNGEETLTASRHLNTPTKETR